MNPLRFYKCLADGTRLRSVLLIAREGELCVCELMEALGESQPKISRHLAQLRECGLVCDRRQGQWVFYRLAPQLPEWAAAVLQQTLAGDEAFLSEPLQRLEDMANRPERCSGNC
ncbi:metalloregulator ArsR/SmtB family transcription factor [Microbulbifer sediminum]|uniref:metalloregulator ArsR/SmtB family transcription factor n=1 Tax=Microbulbifer sediminum TaxID=2904250 RepID=UPI001F02DC67|nr:metalloregulator ArsR/SmtB family transcription factor [Microbulbifer sediminum]